MHCTAKDVLKSIETFNKALEGPSGDEEADAAIAMRDCVLDYLRSNPEGLFELADLVDEFEAKQEAL